VDAAAVASPLSTIERSLQRHRIRNRPPLPLNRQDLQLQPQQSTTSDGRPFLLVDDGADDRLLVFGTDAQLQRLAVAFFKLTL